MLEATGKLIWRQERNFQQSEAMKLAYAEGRIKTAFSKGHKPLDEWKEASRQANLGKSRHNVPHSEETKDKIRKNTVGNRLKQAKKTEPTSIELMLYTHLDTSKVHYEPQKRVGHYIVDAYISSLNLAIEADGDYWHSTERAKLTDARKDAFLKSSGHTVLRITETDFKNGKYVHILDKILEK